MSSSSLDRSNNGRDNCSRDPSSSSFSFSSTQPSSPTTTRVVAPAMKESVKVLYPRVGRKLVADKHHHKQERNRFSQLLLEHGEQHLQDWAVVASSCLVPWEDDSSTTPTNGGGGGMNGNNNSGSKQKRRQQFYSTSSRLRSSSSFLKKGTSFGYDAADPTTSPSTNMGSIEGRLRLCTRSVVFEPNDITRGIVRCPFQKMDEGPELISLQADFASSSSLSSSLFTGVLPVPNSAAAASAAAAGVPRRSLTGPGPSCSSISSTTRSNSKLIRNTSSGSSSASRTTRMAGGGGTVPTTAGSDENDVGVPVSVVVVRCNRHLVMKTNNIIGPFDSVDAPVEFRFTFLHSTPDKFIELSQTLFNMVKGKGPKSKPDDNDIHPSSLDDILKPMLDRPFDPTNFVDVRERPQTSNLRCSLLTPLLSQPGCAIVTKERIYFQPAAGIMSAVAAKAIHWAQSDIIATARRYNGLHDCALELFLNNGTSVLLAFEGIREREQVIRLLPRSIPCHTDRSFVTEAAKEWQRGALNNFEYLLVLNSSAGRTFHDLSRYPVFPWVIADYESCTLDLNDESTFRDLSKPVGALNEDRLEYFRTRLKGMHGMDDPFLYGTHYSAPGYVLYYLVRSMPEHMLCLQNGKFDTADRMFHSLYQCYSCVLTNHADVKELIPEFYDPSAGFDFLINARGLQLGTTQTGERVHDVKLPPWAKSPRDFLKKNRKALESDTCTRMLPRWIDLIFGEKSRGEKAMEASNVFHRTAYLGPADLDSMKSDEERKRAELQAMEFGIVPDKLFRLPHPSKTDEVVWEDVVAPESGRASFVEIDEKDLDLPQNSGGSSAKSSSQHGDQAWELLDVPIKPNGSIDDGDNSVPPTTDDISSRDAVTLSPTRSVGFGSSSFAPNSKMMKYVEKNKARAAEAAKVKEESNALATPGRKAKASWTKNFDLKRSSPEMEMSQDSVSVRDEEGKMASQYSRWIDARGGAEFRHDENRFKSPNENTVTSRNSGNRVLSLSGSGDYPRERRRRGFVAGQNTGENGSYNQGSKQVAARFSEVEVSDVNSTNSAMAASRQGWDLKPIASKMMHGDSVSGCCLLLQEGPDSRSYLITVSLDGNLMVHTLPKAQRESEAQGLRRRSFSGARTATLSRLPYLMSGDRSSSSSQTKLNSFRTHSSSDPLACLALTSDDHGGLIVFAGGHDDVVVAYGINSACALASVYSHRDAVTGIDILRRSSFGNHADTIASENSTHIMVTGSWDATVKVWSVSIAAGETVSINREPLAELFDADSSIVCVSATEVRGIGIAICAGCADGTFIVWLCRDDGSKEVLHKEISKRGSGPCAAAKWACLPGMNKTCLFAGFAKGRVTSYVLSGNVIRPLSRVSLGVPVQCLFVGESVLLAGCADGGLRLLPFDDGHFDTNPVIWKAVNGKTSPGLSCVALAAGTIDYNGCRCFCATGADNGSVALFELKRGELD